MTRTTPMRVICENPPSSTYPKPSHEDANTLVGLFPLYWAVKAYWMAQASDPNWPLVLGIGILAMSALLGVLMRRFRQVVYR